MKQVELLTALATTYPSISLARGDNFYWSPAEKKVFYRPDNTTDEGSWALLHESGHALLDHTQYYSDIELVIMEVEAWEKAKLIAKEINSQDLGSEIYIDEDHIQDCLDSYRDWLHKRSLCPDCKLSGAQINSGAYSCVFCHKKWRVSADRFCRPYRRKATSKSHRAEI